MDKSHKIILLIILIIGFIETTKFSLENWLVAFEGNVHKQTLYELVDTYVKVEKINILIINKYANEKPEEIDLILQWCVLNHNKLDTLLKIITHICDTNSEYNKQLFEYIIFYKLYNRDLLTYDKYDEYMWSLNTLIRTYSLIYFSYDKLFITDNLNMSIYLYENNCF